MVQWYGPIPWFSDPFLTYLRSFGWNTVRFPKADLQPLEVLTKDGRDLERFGQLSTIMIGDGTIAIPKPNVNKPAADINGQRTSDLKIGTGLTILGSIISAMGGSPIGLDVNYKRGNSIAFEYSAVYQDNIEVAALDQYLGSADINPYSRYAAKLLESDKVYVITSTIKSKKFTVGLNGSSGTEVKLNVPEIQALVGANVKVSSENKESSKLSYEGNIPLIFGFQAVRLFYDNGRYTAFKPAEPDIGAKALEKVPEDNTERLLGEEPFTHILD
jgi:hypothetical protein